MLGVCRLDLACRVDTLDLGLHMGQVGSISLLRPFWALGTILKNLIRKLLMLLFIPPSLQRRLKVASEILKVILNRYVLFFKL